MKYNAVKVLQIIAFILMFLALAFVVAGWLFFKNELVGLISKSTEALNLDMPPWENIIETGFVLFVGLIWLIVVLSRPGRAATITFTILLSMLLIGYHAVGCVYATNYFTSLAGREGASALAGYSSLRIILTTFSRFALIPAQVLMLLSMGGACGRSYKQPIVQAGVSGDAQRPYAQRPNAESVRKPAAASHTVKPQGNGASTPHAQHGYNNQPQNPGYNPQVQNTGHIPLVNAALLNTGHLPPANEPVQNAASMHNTGYVTPPDVEASIAAAVSQAVSDTPKEDVTFLTEQLPEVENAAENAVENSLNPSAESAVEDMAKPEVNAAPQAEKIYPWQAAAGRPKEENKDE